MIINRIYETLKSYVAVACFRPGRAKDLSAPRVYHIEKCWEQQRQRRIKHILRKALSFRLKVSKTIKQSMQKDLC
jgi:hypothetical protein